MNELPTAPFKRIMKKYADMVSESAVDTLQREVEGYANELAKQAAEATKLSRRRIVKPEDVDFVINL